MACYLKLKDMIDMMYDNYRVAEGAYYYNSLNFSFGKHVVDGPTIYLELYKDYLRIPYIKSFCNAENLKVMYVPFFTTIQSQSLPIYLGYINVV
jgi:hypothetical protein